MKYKKRKLKKKPIKLLVFILIIIVILILIFSNIPNKNSLDKIGYSDLEINEINKLSNDEINTIMKYDYNKNLIYIIDSETYNKKNLNLYLKYTEKYKDIDYSKIMKIIDNESFVDDNVDKYMELLSKYDSIDGIIKYVNDYSKDNIDLNETTLKFIEQKYFIYPYFNRYIKYYKNNSNLDIKEIVTRVNCNLDYIFYKDVNKADTSKGMYTLVNKYNYLDKNYVPGDLVNVEDKYVKYSAKLVKVAYENFVKMADDASKEGLTLKITTGYRDYSFQSTLYNNYVATDGVKNADTYSARPGYSEHQLGYSADLTNRDNASFDEFEYTDEYKWLQKNAYKYGFIMRYPKDKEYLTGYIFEAWHYRYVGVEIATYIYENDITYEEYYEYYLNQK